MLVLPPQLTHEQAVACLDLLMPAVAAEQGMRVVVDASELKQFDSSALAVLLGLRRACLRARKSFAVRGLTPHLRELAGLYGVDELLPVAPDDETETTDAAA